VDGTLASIEASGDDARPLEAGEVVCPSATPTLCSGVCVDLTAPSNCGSCGHACTAEAGTPVCAQPPDGAAASCVSGCPPSTPSLCAGTCVDTTSDVNNCGMCSNPCSTSVANATATCVAGACTIKCNSSYTSCNGACVDLASDANHCGGCTTVCSGGLCGTTLSADMSARPQNWTFNGVAVWDSTGPSARLTQANTEQVSGTAVYNHAIVTDAFDASFQFRIGANGGGAFDGMGFMIETNGPTALGSNAGGLGMEGLTGFGVELDIYNNGQCGDSNSDHVGVDRLNDCGNGLLTSLFASPALTGTVNLDDAQWHTATVDLAAGAISVTVDAHAVATGVALTGFVSGTSYYYGFAGAIGGGGGSLGAQTEVKGVTVTFPSPRCL